MPRLPRFNAPGLAQHIIQRGNNRQPCFSEHEDYCAYAGWLREYADRYFVDIHAWVFMTNHVHLLVTPRQSCGVSMMMQSLGRQYVQYFNHKYQRSGTLWEGRFRSCLVDSEEYVLECYRYIELNPVRAKMVDSPEDYHWSSHATNARGLISNLCTPHSSFIALGRNSTVRQKHYRELFIGQTPQNMIDDIRSATQSGVVLGSESFKQDLKKKLGRRVDHRRRGRPTKNRL